MKTIELKWIEDDNHIVAEDAYNELKELIETGVFPNLTVKCEDDTLYITGEKEDLDKAVMKIQKAYAKYGQIMMKEAKNGTTEELRIESFDDNVQDIFNHTLAEYETFKENTKEARPNTYITTLGKFQYKFNKLKEAAAKKDKKILQNILMEIDELTESYEEVKFKPISESYLFEGKLIDSAALMVYSQLVDLGYKHSAQQIILNNIDYINEHSDDNPSELTDNIIKRWKRQEKRRNKEYEKLNNESYEEINEDSLDDMIDNTGHDPKRIATKGFSGYIPPAYYKNCRFEFVTKNWRDMEKYGFHKIPVFFPRNPVNGDNKWMTHTCLSFKQTLKLFDKVPDKILKVIPRQRNGWSFDNVDGDYVSKDAWIAFAKNFLGIEPPKSRKPRVSKEPEMTEENESFNEDYNYYKNPFRQMAEKRKKAAEEKKRNLSKDKFSKKFLELAQTYAGVEGLDIEVAYDKLMSDNRVFELVDSTMSIEDIMDKISAGELLQ